jgi:hypothetical protein
MVAVIAANGHWSRGGLDGGNLAGDALVQADGERVGRGIGGGGFT